MTTSSTLEVWNGSSTSWARTARRNSPAALTDEENPPSSSDGEDDSDQERGKSNSGAKHELATLDVDDGLDEGKQPLILETPTGYVLASSAPVPLTAELVKRPIVLRLELGRLMRAVTWQAQARTRHLHDYRVFVYRDRSTHSVTLPLSKYSVDETSGNGSWAQLECLAQAGRSDKESQEGGGEDFYDEEDEEEAEKNGRVNDAKAVERPKRKIQGQMQACRLGRGGSVDRAI